MKIDFIFEKNILKSVFIKIKCHLRNSFNIDSMFNSKFSNVWMVLTGSEMQNIQTSLSLKNFTINQKNYYIFKSISHFHKELLI